MISVFYKVKTQGIQQLLSEELSSNYETLINNAILVGLYLNRILISSLIAY